MPNTRSFPVTDKTFRYKLLAWSAGFKSACFLDSNPAGITSVANAGKHSFQSVDCMVAAGETTSITPSSGCFEELSGFRSRTEGPVFGFISYDLKNEIEDLPSQNPDFTGAPLMHFFAPKHLVKLNGNELTITSPDDPRKIFHDIHDQLIKEQPPGKPSVSSRISRSEYISVVREILHHISLGDFYEINFCQEFYAEETTIDPVSVYLRLNRLTSSPFSAFFRLNDLYLLSASPERFLKKEGNRLISQPIKGTIRRGENEEEDRLLTERLRNDPKEQSENVMIVDLVRNDLARTARPGSVKVDELFGIYTFGQVHQMISTIESELRGGLTWKDALINAFPMGSMTGAPKISAMKWIDRFEKVQRRLFSGSVGYITHEGDFDFNVVIRSIIYNAERRYVSFMTGSAITANSIPENEYEECLLKANAMKKALGSVEL